VKEGRGLVIAATGVAAVMTLAVAVIVGGHEPADASVLSHGSGGWLAARRYLEEKGSRVTLLDHGLDSPLGPGVLVVAFPWQQLPLDDVERGLDLHLQAGGDVVFAYSGNRMDDVESAVLEALDLEWRGPAERPPLHPLRWRRYASEERLLTPEPAAAGRPLRIAAPRRVPRAPREADVIARDAAGPAVFSFPRWRGRVVVLPADAFSNARIAEPGNADLLETLRQTLAGPWIFDEFHHGLRAPLAAAQAMPQHIFLLYLGQIAFVYALIVLAVVHRFGPAWREPAASTGSAATFLLGLGALHHRLGHAREAARLLRSRAQELDPRLVLPAETGDGPEAFLQFARRVGRAQAGRGPHE
jgi:hypothetical protein